RALQRASARKPVLEWSLSEAQREVARISLTLASSRQETKNSLPGLATLRFPSLSEEA
ncbi:hypothetical protein A2U01_0095869, partial [Trifolium medium]|nr:hypothetical protein [Trifolium medium]